MTAVEKQYMAALERRIATLEAMVLGAPIGDPKEECREALRALMKRNDKGPLEAYIKKWGKIPTDLMEGM